MKSRPGPVWRHLRPRTSKGECSPLLPWHGTKHPNNTRTGKAAAITKYSNCQRSESNPQVSTRRTRKPGLRCTPSYCAEAPVRPPPAQAARCPVARPHSWFRRRRHAIPAIALPLHALIGGCALGRALGSPVPLLDSLPLREVVLQGGRHVAPPRLRRREVAPGRLGAHQDSRVGRPTGRRARVMSATTNASATRLSTRRSSRGMPASRLCTRRSASIVMNGATGSS